MRAYVIEVERFDPTKPPNNIRHERCVVLATITQTESSKGEICPTVFAVYGENDLEPQKLGEWCAAERAALYEQIREDERHGFCPIPAPRRVF